MRPLRWVVVAAHRDSAHEPSGRARLSQRAATMRNQDGALGQTRPTMFWFKGAMRVKMSGSSFLEGEQTPLRRDDVKS